MRLVTFQRGDEARLGAVVGDGVIDLAEASGGVLPSSMLALIAEGEPAWETAREVAASGFSGAPLSQVKLLAPIPRPRKNVFCLGLNYREHAAEGARAAGVPLKLPEHPIYFTKPPTAVIGPDAPIVIDPKVSTQIDWEVEFTLIIGKGGRDIAPEEVFDHIFGYTIANDVSARDLQFRHGQWFRGKSLDSSAPLGPWIVTADEVPNPGNLRVMLRVNGETKQDSNTNEFIFDIPAMVSVLSAGITLEPGDVILTGTPSGVGFARTPPEWLKDGDVIEAEVEGIGVLRNTFKAGGAA